MNLLTASTRKRQRSAESEGDQSLPISKRINQLHIRPSYEGLEATSVEYQWPENNNAQWSGFHSNSPSVISNQQSFLTLPATVTSLQPPYPAIDPGNSSVHGHFFNNGMAVNHQLPSSSAQAYVQPSEQQPMADYAMMRYEPELNKTENPNYYASNEQLFYLHMEKLQRLKNP